MLAALLLSLAASASYTAPVNLASLSACGTQTLEIELNVDGKTPKYQIIEAIKLFADYPSFSITPTHSEQSTLRFKAVLKDNCVSDSCARADGWFDLQQRLNRLKGVDVSCAEPKGGRGPTPQPGMPVPPGGSGQPGQPGQPPPPGAGGVTGSN